MTNIKKESRKKWSHTSLGIIFLLLFFFPSGVYLMWRYSGWGLKTKLLISGFFFLVVFLFSLAVKASDGIVPNVEQSKTSKQELRQEVDEGNKPSPTNILKTEAPKAEGNDVTSLEKIQEIVKSKTGGVESVIFSADDLATSNNPPYNVIVNFPFDHSISSCFGAKSVSHEILESLYSDSLVRGSIERVMVTIPYYLRVSLGSFDGVPMGEKDEFGGPSLFWQILIDSTGYENENGKLANRTWGVLLDKCE